MKKIRKGDKEYEINCDNLMCGNCSFKPTAFSEQKCKLFDVILNHLVNGLENNSGWERPSECISAEVKGHATVTDTTFS